MIDLNTIKLRLPVKDVFVTQPFGVNYMDFYKKMGMLGHNGIDFRARHGCPTYATHDGIITWAGVDGDGGISVNITSSLAGDGFYTVHYHLLDVAVKVGDHVSAGDLVGHCDNTGSMTSGDHLHYGLKLTFNGATINKGNGYNGAINPAPYFVASYNGVEIGNKDWDKSRCYHRYYRGRPKGGYEIEKYKVVPALVKYLGRLPDNEEINACTYGGWDREVLKNPLMYEIYSQLKKDEFFEKGQRPFC